MKKNFRQLIYLMSTVVIFLVKMIKIKILSQQKLRRNLHLQR